MDALTVRALAVSEWELFREFRLTALKEAQGVFAASHADAAKRTPETWQSLVSGPTNQIFGLFDGERLVGITGAFASPDDCSGATATLVMSYIVPAYRGRGLSRLLYAAALDWTRAHPRFKRIIVAMRASNAASRRACEHHGFTPVRTETRTWPDGANEDEIILELRL
jgi:RimJ/RimL family protein N-acetyltransferase